MSIDKENNVTHSMKVILDTCSMSRSNEVMKLSIHPQPDDASCENVDKIRILDYNDDDAVNDY